jgi:hypothetical protein
MAIAFVRVNIHSRSQGLSAVAGYNDPHILDHTK